MNTFTRWKITGTFTTTSPMHVGSGHIGKDHRLLNEKNEKNCEIQSVVRDYQGRPCIPGSGIKGVLRSWAEKHFEGCPEINRIFGPKDCSESGWAEFGTALYTGLGTHTYILNVPYWYDQRLGADKADKTKKDRTLFSGILSHVAINRKTGAAEANKLFFEEFVPEGMTFEFVIHATRLTREEVAFLLAVLELGSRHSPPYQFGANGADGWGRVKCSAKETTQGIKPADITVSPQGSVSFDVTLQFPGPFLVNDTSRTKRDEMTDADKARHANFTALKKANGQIWLPASSFRGAFRSRLEFLAASLGNTESVERIFGKTSQAARFHLTEFEQAAGPQSLVRQDFVAIDRFTGGAADGAKFDALYADRPQLKTTLCINTKGLEEDDLKLIAATLHDLQEGYVCFGFGGSKGYGEAKGILDDAGKEWLSKHIRKMDVDPTSAVPQLQLLSTPNENVSTRAITANPIPTEKIKTGKLHRRMKGKSIEWVLEVPNDNGSAEHRGIASAIPAGMKLETFDSLDIEFESNANGRPKRIRKVGETWPSVGSAANLPFGGIFANPYAFLRMQDRVGFKGDLQDQNPTAGDSPHVKYLAGKYSGRIHVLLKTQTPLLLCGRARDENAEHKIYPVLLRDGQPLLASSSVRGMLRSAYEAITNSRFGVFSTNSDNGHQVRLAYRRVAKIDVEPAYIQELTPERMVLKVLTARWVGAAPKLPRYQKSPPPKSLDKGESRAALRYPDGQFPQHGDRVVVQVSDNGKVTKIQPHPGTLPGTDWYEGFVSITGANFSNKQCERVFVVSTNDKKLELNQPEITRLQSLWSELIADYQSVHERDLDNREKDHRQPGDYLGNEPGKTGWSRHVYESSWRKLKAGMCVYVRRSSNGQVTDLFPVSISRKLYDKSPLQSVPPTLLPATSIAELSPADRLFGWVSQDSKTGSTPAYRSQVRIGVVECRTPANEAIVNEPKTLAILGQPKPAQGRFYVGNNNGYAYPKGGTKEERGYTVSNRIRGPKVYPHHAQGVVPEDAYSAVNDNQNRTVEGYVAKGTEFAFDLHFTNLSQMELGALLWLFQLPPDHFLRLGLGKPLGFGSLHLEIENAVIAEGSKWIEKIGTDGMLPSCQYQEFIAAFESAINAANPQLLGAFKQAAKGFGDTPIHYPRLPEQKAGGGENFKWFEANERGGKYSLPDLAGGGTPGLPGNPSN